MIELTDERFRDSVQDLLEDLLWVHAYHRRSISDKSVDKFIRSFKALLTKDQVKQLAEQHGMSCVEWHRFDAKDESTYPEMRDTYNSYTGADTKVSAVVQTNRDVGVYVKNIGWRTVGWEGDKNNRLLQEVTYWAEMPKPVEGE